MTWAAWNRSLPTCGQSVAVDYPFCCCIFNGLRECSFGMRSALGIGRMCFRRRHAFSSRAMKANDLQIAVTQGENATILSLSGRVSVDSSPILRDRLLAVLRSEGPPAVIVELSRTPYVDCSGIATLIEALKIARNRKVALRLTGMQGRLKNLFEITGVMSLFEASSHTTASGPKEF